ncbi:hypothetical protein R1T16_12890 [Flavobacterium sp. DG1-102-2]|uniref:hypothetical protein n=1 Tax=Flavobacterium sp. DG1-102-2 TaxID=3081663 RepID=UPI00294A7DC7|nr:hypothetical protein [Flavobacterium sp. DG1-102-2]MDV6169325.1 hypothetical protein [Flavobacterium sp. DG1-102-2]
MKIKLVVFILTILMGCNQYVWSQVYMFKDKQSRHWGLNLKDSVKCVRFMYTKYKEGLNSLDKSRIYLSNDIRTNFYLEFTERGNLSASKIFMKTIDEIVHRDSIYQYVYDNKDIEEKSKYLVKNIHPVFPVYFDGLIKLNFIQHAKLEGTTSQTVYNYVVENGMIKEEKEYFVDVIDRTFDDRLDESELVNKIIYSYDKNGNLSSRKIFAGKFGEAIGNLPMMETEVPYCDDTEVRYTYDNQNRITKVVLYGCKTIVSSEEYTYHSSKNYITTLKRYIAEPLLSRYPSRNMIAEYNEYGDITHMHFIVENDTSPPRKKIGLEPVDRYYEYDYDSHNNWIRCRLYLMGEKDEPTIIAERKIEYYN